MKKRGKRRRKMSCFPCFWSRGKATRRTKSDRMELSVSLHSRSLKQQQHHHHHAPPPPPPPRPTPAGHFSLLPFFSLHFFLEIFRLGFG